MLEVDISKVFPQFNLNVKFHSDRETLVLFGPSGAGKSMTIQCIAGLAKPDKGIIRLGQRVLFKKDDNEFISVPIHQRNIGYVFQNYALFPHMTVAQNLLYGLRDKKRSQEKLHQFLSRLHLSGLAERYPHQLSGGQQQRVALGRALMIDPELLLLDEPFAALDGAIRESLQQDIIDIQREMGLVVIYITHNLMDAFVLGDRLAIIQDGQLHQIGPIQEVFQHPNNRTVAEITGVRNLFEGKILEADLEGLRIEWGGVIIFSPPAARKVGESIYFYIRPDDVKLIYPDRPVAPSVSLNLIAGVIEGLISKGTTISVRIRPLHIEEIVESRIPTRTYQQLKLKKGMVIQFSMLRDAISILPPEGIAGKQP